MWLVFGLTAAFDGNMRTQLVAEVLPDGQLVMPDAPAAATTVFTTTDRDGAARVLPHESLVELEQEATGKVLPFDTPPVQYPRPDVEAFEDTAAYQELQEATENLRKAPDLDKYIGHPFIATSGSADSPPLQDVNPTASPEELAAAFNRVDTWAKAAGKVPAVERFIPEPAQDLVSPSPWSWAAARFVLLLLSAAPLVLLEVWAARAAGGKDSAWSGVSGVSGVSTANVSITDSDLSGSAASCVSVTTSCCSVSSDAPERVEPSRPWMPLLDLARLAGAVHLMASQLACGRSPILPGTCAPRALWLASLGPLWVGFFLFAAGFLLVYRHRPGKDSARESVTTLAPVYFLALFLGALAAPAAIARGWADVGPLGVLSALAMADAVAPPFTSCLTATGWIMSALVCMWLASPRWQALLDQLKIKGVWQLLAGCWAATLVPVLASAVLIGPTEGSTAAFLQRSPLVLAPLFLGGMAWAELFLRRQLAIGARELGAALASVLLGLGLVGHIAQLQPARTVQLLQAFPLFPVLCGFLLLCAASGDAVVDLPLLAGKDGRLQHFIGAGGRLAWPVIFLHTPLALLVAEHSSTAPHFPFCAAIVLLVCAAYTALPAPWAMIERGVAKSKLLVSRHALREALHEAEAVET